MEVYLVDCIKGITKVINTNLYSYNELLKSPSFSSYCDSHKNKKEETISITVYERFLARYVEVINLDKQITPYAQIEIYDDNNIFTLSNKSILFETSYKIQDIYDSGLINMGHNEPLFIHKVNLASGSKKLIDVLDVPIRYKNECINRLIKNYNY